MTTKPLGQLFADADRWLRHWQMVAGIGRPADWAPLTCSPENYAEMVSRIGQVGGTFAGTEQHVEMVKLVAIISSPEPAKPTLEDRLRALAEKTGETFGELHLWATQHEKRGELTEEGVANLEAAWAKHEAGAVKADADELDSTPAAEEYEEETEPGASG
jgi:hypothetical protein